MAMSREHYKQMAEILKQYHPSSEERNYALEEHIFTTLVTDIMNFFKMENPNFSYEKFLDAVYGNEYE